MRPLSELDEMLIKDKEKIFAKQKKTKSAQTKCWCQYKFFLI